MNSFSLRKNKSAHDETTTPYVPKSPKYAPGHHLKLNFETFSGEDSKSVQKVYGETEVKTGMTLPQKAVMNIKREKLEQLLPTEEEP